MEVNKGKGAVNALLGEYKKAIGALQHVIEDIGQPELKAIVDPLTDNPDCTSVQTILAHVVRSAYSYCVYIQNSRDIDSKRPEKIFRSSSNEFINDLNNVLQFTYDTFFNIYDDELDEVNEEKKIKTNWGKLYDIEQIMEHAIVHILRHRRQIEKFKLILKG